MPQEVQAGVEVEVGPRFVVGVVGPGTAVPGVVGHCPGVGEHPDPCSVVVVVAVGLHILQHRLVVMHPTSLKQTNTQV